MLSNMSVIRVTVRDLLHNSRTVLAQVQAGQRIELTRRGRVVAVLTAPEPAELAMDELVETGHLREHRSRVVQQIPDRNPDDRHVGQHRLVG